MAQKKILFFITLVVATSFSYGQLQVKLLDNLTKENIPFVHVYIENGAYSTIANQFGQVIIPSRLLNQNHEITVVFQHVAYKTQTVTLQQNNNTVNVYLEKLPYQMEEVEVVAKKKTKDTRYIVLKGFYRSYQFVNNIPKYYTDGFVEYYIPLSSNKKKIVKNNILENRTFGNEVLISNNKTRTININMDSYGPPYIYEKTSLDDIAKEYTVSPEHNRLSHIINVKDTIGSISYNPESKSTLLNIDIYFSDSAKVRKLFGYLGKYKHFIFSEVYSPSMGISSTNSYQNLERKQDYKKVLFKHKSEEEFQSYEVTNEFYVLERFYIHEKEMKKLNIKGYSIVRNTTRTEPDYIERIKKLNLPELPLKVSSALKNNTLIDINNIKCQTCGN